MPREISIIHLNVSPNLSHISFLKEFCGRRSRTPCLSHLRGTSEIDFCKDESSTSGKADFNSLSNLIRNSSAGLTFFDILAHSMFNVQCIRNTVRPGGCGRSYTLLTKEGLQIVTHSHHYLWMENRFFWHYLDYIITY